jgi:hypothetical protein
VEPAERPGEPVIVAANVIAPARGSGSARVRRIRATEVRGPADDPYSGYDVEVTCACGDRWKVDLLAVLEGRDQPLRRDTWQFPGVSWRRQRHKDQ